MPTKTALHLNDVNAAFGEFPNGESWARIDLPDPGRALRWTYIEEACGVYVFAARRGEFRFRTPIHLHAKDGHTIEFEPIMQAFTYVGNELDVLYVGKTSNLKRRLPLHFRESAVLGNQLIKGMANVSESVFREQRNWFLTHGMVLFCKFQYPEEAGAGYRRATKSRAADRDLLELSLIAKFAPPFNIKAER